MYKLIVTLIVSSKSLQITAKKKLKNMIWRFKSFTGLEMNRTKVRGEWNDFILSKKGGATEVKQKYTSVIFMMQWLNTAKCLRNKWNSPKP